MQLALFIIFGALALGGALNLLFQRHPINSALSLVVVMMSLAVLYWSLGAEFLAAAQVIVYSGAIMVLFVFVIMLLNAGEEERTDGSRAASIVGFPGAAAIFCLLSFVFLSERDALKTVNVVGDLGNGLDSKGLDNIAQVSQMLFTRQLLPFEVTSILILVAILGAVVLARKEH
jgi:NADH-quinone oxidoreductase subunit J